MLVPWENAVKPPYLYVDQNWSQANKPLSYVGFFLFPFFLYIAKQLEKKNGKL
jgi:hypothetical protein